MNIREYWEKKAERRIRLGDTMTASAVRELQEIYDSSSSSVKKEIEAFLGLYSKDGELSLSDLRKILSRAELRQYRKDVDKYIETAKEIENTEASRQYQEELRKERQRKNVARQQAIHTALLFYMMSLGIEEEKILKSSMADAYRQTYAHDAFDYQQYTGKGETVRKPDDSQVNSVLRSRWVGSNYSDRIWNDKRKLLSELETTLLRGISMHRDADSIAFDISKNLGVSFRNARRLVTTEISYVQGEATKAMYKTYGVSRYQFVATLDDRTSEICRSTDGMVFNLRDAEVGINWPPLHSWCRSSTVPYIENADEDSTRAARDQHGRNIYVPASMTYREWEEKYLK